MPYRDHESRAAWLGSPFPLDTSVLPVRSNDIPSQYGSLSKFVFDDRLFYKLTDFPELGYAAKSSMTMEQRLKLGANVEHILSTEKEAAKAPPKL